METDTRTGLDQNIAGALCYLLTFITGILFYVIEDRNRFVRFHAAQSIVTFGGLFLFSIILGAVSTAVFPVPGIGPIVAALLGTISLFLIPVSVGLWIYLMYKAYNGVQYRLPFAAQYADRLL